MSSNSGESPTAWGHAVVGLFCRLLEAGRAPRLSLKAIGLWAWLERHGLPDLLTTIAHRSDKILQLVAAEAETMVAFLESTSTDVPALHVTVDISLNEFPLDEIVVGRERVAKEIMEICEGTLHDLLDGVFKERKIDISSDKDEEEEEEEEEEAKIDEQVVVEGGDDDSPKMAAAQGEGGGSLNPGARAWSPESGRAPVEDRCLYLTFSFGQPLSADQIDRFFTRRYGRCVESVYVPYRGDQGSHPPLFGKVYFRASYIPAMILGGEDVVRFCVAGKTLYCKRYRRAGNEGGEDQ